MSTDDKAVVIHRHDHVALVTFHRGRHNYFDTPLIEELATAYEAMAETNWCRAIVLSSEGRHFCAGLDFATSSTADIPSLYGAALRLFTAPLPVVAAVQGAAIGGGCGLALSADFRVAAHEARFCTNFARIGFHHGFALSATLPAAVGQQAAADLLLTGRRVPGDEALVMGLCDRLVAGDELIAAAISYATELAEGAPLAVRAIRATLRRRLVEDAHHTLEQECTQQLVLSKTADFAEGVRAAAEHRPPQFRGA